MEDQIKEAKIKALKLLERMDRTEAQLRSKLKEKGFDEDAIMQAIAYVKKFGYINDTNYATRFAENRKRGKSKRELYYMLQQKGVHAEDIADALEDAYEAYDEKETMMRLLEKKNYNPETATELEKKKLYDYLARKGFRHEDIRQVLQVSFWNA
jgi:regulatory protein